MKLSKVEKIILLLLVVLLIAAFFLPLRVSKSIAVQGKLLAVKEWLVVRDDASTVAVILKQYLPPMADELTSFSSERGDVMQLQVNEQVRDGNMVDSTTVIAQIQFNAGLLDVTRAERRLAETRSKLALYSSGDKQALRREAQRRIELARQELELSEKELQRKRELFKSNLISRADFEQAESMRDIRLSALQIRQAELENVTSGSKPELLQRVRDEIIGYEQELVVLKQRLQLGQLKTPFKGRLLVNMLSDTLLRVADTSRCLLVPIPYEYRPRIHRGQDGQFMINGKEVDATLKHVSETVRDVQGRACVLAVFALDQPNSGAALNSVWTGQIKTDGRLLRVLLWDFINAFLGN